MIQAKTPLGFSKCREQGGSEKLFRRPNKSGRSFFHPLFCEHEIVQVAPANPAAVSLPARHSFVLLPSGTNCQSLFETFTLEGAGKDQRGLFVRLHSLFEKGI